MKIKRLYNLKIGGEEIKLFVSSKRRVEAIDREKPSHTTKLLSDDWHAVDSSFIDAIAYNPATKLLKVKLNNGRNYSFDDVPKKIFKDFLNSGSKGKYFNDVIKKRY